MINGRFIAAAIFACLTASSAAAEQVANTSTPSTSAASEQEFRARIAELQRQLQNLKQQLSVGASAASEDATAAVAASSVDERLEELDQRLRIMDREDELRREAQAEQARTAPGVSANRDGFQFRSADGAFLLRLRGLLHSDGRFFVNDSAETGADTFLVRRVRPIIDATMFKNYDVRLMPDFGNGQTVLQDAYLDMRFSTPFKVRAGKFKSPFGIERLVSASELLFAERALPTGVAPNRDVGIMAYGDLLAGRLSYFAGAFNGVADGGSGDLDDRDGKDLVIRLFTHPFRTSKNANLQGLGLGVAASHGTQRGSTTAPALPTYLTAGAQTFFRYLSDGTANGTVVADGTRRRISAQGYYYAGRLGLLGEQVYSAQDVRKGTLTADANTNAWQLAGSWVLTGERASYRGVTPRTVLDPGNGTWGAFEITARYNELRVGDQLFPIFASRTAAARQGQGGGAGLNWYLNRNVKLVFDYEEIRFRGGAASGDRAPARELLSRVQFSF